MDHNKLLAQIPMPRLEGPGIIPVSINPVSTLEQILTTLVGFLSILAIIWFTIQIILSGYKYISSQGDKNKIEEASKSITNSLIGLAITLLAVFLVSFIGTILGIPNILDLTKQFNKITN